MQSRRFPFALVFALAATTAAAAGEKEFAAVKEAFAKRDLVLLSRLSEAEYKNLIATLNPEQLNKVALLAGENLEIASVLKGVKYDKFFDLLVQPTLNVKVHERWQLNSVSMNLIRRLSDERKITDSAVLPHVVQALDHPYSTIRRYAYYTLRNLAYRNVGWEVFDRGTEEAEKRKPAFDWWQNWLKKNKGKHLIVDVELETKLRKCSVDTMQHIFASLGKKYDDELLKTAMPTKSHLSHAHLPDIAYTPRRMAFIAGPGPRPLKLDELSSLWIGVQFLTPGPDLERKAESWPFGKGGYKVVYEEAQHNTDLVFRVILDTPNAKLEADMIRLFKKDKGK